MSRRNGVVIIGAGHNGLVTAFYLARAGFKPLVLERRPVVGGVAVTEEFYPGFKCPTVAHVAGPLRPDVARDMQLAKFGLRLITPEVRLCALSPDAPPLLLYDNPKNTAAALARRSPREAGKYLEFHEVLSRIGQVFAELARMTPPSVDEPSPGDLYRLLKTGRRVRKLGKKDMYRLLRWGPMPVADLMDEWFESELLKSAIGARGIFASALGPHSPGSSNLLLLRSADDPHPAGPAAFPAGGMGALTQALASAATAAGATIRTGAEVAGIEVKDGAVSGVRLSDGQAFPASTVISNADPVRTLLGLLDPTHLAPHFLAHVQHYRSSGVVAKVNLALDALPGFTALQQGDSPGSALSGRVHIGPTLNYLEKAFDASKYGSFSRQPYLDLVVPSVADPSLAPAGKHVMSVHAQFAPYQLRESNWSAQADAFGDAVVQTLATYAPDLPSRILHRQVITPADLEQTFGLTGGHILHGELTLDQFFTMRPLLGWARYRTPIQGLYLCGSGTHPGSGLTGGSGANAAREILKDLR